MPAPSNDELIDQMHAAHAALCSMLDEVKSILAARRAELDWLEVKYNPFWRDQPRAPVGRRDGGQWVSNGGANAKPSRILKDNYARRPIDLTQHERSPLRPWGGHTIERHVAQPFPRLRRRVEALTLRFGPIFGQRFEFSQVTASSFTSLSEANRLVLEVLDSHQIEVSAVAAGRLPAAILYSRIGRRTGYEAYRRRIGEGIRVRDTYSILVVIRHEANSPDGLVVYTAYPTNRNDAIPDVRLGAQP